MATSGDVTPMEASDEETAWDSLPPELLQRALGNLTASELASSACVCRSWR